MHRATWAPQIQGELIGFLSNPEVDRDRVMFPERPVVHFDAWVRTDASSFDGIYITTHAGTTTLAEVEEAREQAKEVPTDRPLRYGELEVGQIDGRTAMAWMEVWEDDGLHEITFRTVVPYDTMTYVVEFLAGNPLFKSNPDTIRAIVATFGIGEIEWNMPLIAVGVLAGLLLLTKVGTRSKPSQNYTLFTLPTEEEEGEGTHGEDALPTVSAPPAGSAFT